MLKKGKTAYQHGYFQANETGDCFYWANWYKNGRPWYRSRTLTVSTNINAVKQEIVSTEQIDIGIKVHPIESNQGRIHKVPTLRWNCRKLLRNYLFVTTVPNHLPHRKVWVGILELIQERNHILVITVVSHLYSRWL